MFGFDNAITCVWKGCASRNDFHLSIDAESTVPNDGSDSGAAEASDDPIIETAIHRQITFNSLTMNRFDFICMASGHPIDTGTHSIDVILFPFFNLGSANVNMQCTQYTYADLGRRLGKVASFPTLRRAAGTCL